MRLSICVELCVEKDHHELVHYEHVFRYRVHIKDCIFYCHLSTHFRPNIVRRMGVWRKGNKLLVSSAVWFAASQLLLKVCVFRMM